MSYFDIDHSYITSIIRLSIGLAAVCINGLYLCMCLKYGRSRSSTSNVIVAFMSVSNFIIGCGVLVRGILGVEDHYVYSYSTSRCLAATLPQSVGIFSNQAVTVGLSVDRLLAIVRPMAYKVNGPVAIFTGLGAVLYTTGGIWLYVYGVDLTAVVPSCSTAYSSGPLFFTFWTVASGGQSLFIVVIYGAIIAVAHSFLSISNFKAQLRRSVTLVLSVQIVCWHVPILTGIIFLFTGAPKTLLAMVTLSVGFGSCIQAILTTGVVIVSHDDRRSSTMRMSTIVKPSVVGSKAGASFVGKY